VKQKNMVELVNQHHPDVGEQQIRIWLNDALREFSRRTKIIKKAYTFDTNLNERYYGLPEYIIEVNSVDYDGYKIPRLIGKPTKRDIT